MLYGRFYQVRRLRGFTEFSEVKHAGQNEHTGYVDDKRFLGDRGYIGYMGYVGHAGYGGGTGYVFGIGYWAHAGYLTCMLNEAGYHMLFTAKWIMMHAV
jgi:hypothetical protein